jgi:hypothetical protein
MLKRGHRIHYWSKMLFYNVWSRCYWSRNVSYLLWGENDSRLIIIVLVKLKWRTSLIIFISIIRHHLNISSWWIYTLIRRKKGHIDWIVLLEKGRLIIDGWVRFLICCGNVSDRTLTPSGTVFDIDVVKVLKICSLISIKTAIFVGHASIK